MVRSKVRSLGLFSWRPNDDSFLFDIFISLAAFSRFCNAMNLQINTYYSTVRILFGIKWSISLDTFDFYKPSPIEFHTRREVPSLTILRRIAHRLDRVGGHILLPVLV